MLNLLLKVYTTRIIWGKWREGMSGGREMREGRNSYTYETISSKIIIIVIIRKRKSLAFPFYAW